MRLHKIIAMVLVTSFALLLVLRMPDAQPNARGAQATPIVIFAVARDDRGQDHIEPIVIMSGARYAAPPTEDEAAAKKFTGSYFRAGRQYRVVFGGGDAGSLTVQKFELDQCLNLVADVSAQTTARLGGQVQALAVSSDQIGRGPGSRRAPTEEERAAALEVARAVYGQQRVGAALVGKMKTINLTATDFERDGTFELIGAFQIDAGNELMHNLFIILEPAGGGKYKAATKWYQKSDNEKGDGDRTLVDVIDLDGDGTAEVIAEEFYVENNWYVIYKRQAGVWRTVYKGGSGGAC